MDQINFLNFVYSDEIRGPGFYFFWRMVGFVFKDSYTQLGSGFFQPMESTSLTMLIGLGEPC